MNPFANTLQGRLKWILTTFGVTLVFIMLGLLLVVGYDAEQRYLKNQVQTLTHLIAANSQGSMLFADKKLLNYSLASLSSLNDVAKACLYDAQNLLIASHVKPDITPCEPSETQGHTNIFTVTKNIVWRNQVLGHLCILADSSAALSEFANLFWILAAIGIFMTIIIIFVSRIFARRETQPLRHLTRSAIAMIDSDEKKLLEVTGFQEIRYLAAAFNGVINDLTNSRQTTELEVQQRRQAQLMEQQSLQLLAEIIDTVPYLIFAQRRNKEVLFANKAVAVHYQTTVEDISSGAIFSDYAGKKPDCFLFSQFGEEDSEQWFLEAGGDSRRFTIARVPFDSGSAELVVAIDITEQHRLQAQLQFSQRLEVVGTLAGGIAHDFNNLLTPILGYTSMLKDRDLPRDVKDKMRAMELAATKARDVVQRILSFSRRQSLSENSEIDVGPILEEAIELMRASVPSTIQIHLHCDPGLKPITGDAGQIHQVIINLCTNAAQSINQSRGNIFIRASLKNSPHPNIESPYINIEVRDDGSGMSKEVASHVFEPFFTTKTIGEGSGLGLSVVHGIVHNHYGDIQLISEEGTGTTFILLLPIAKYTTTTTEIQVTMPETGSERILLVDDEPPVLEVTKQLLLKSGYQVSDFLSASEALTAFQEQPGVYDVVITDNSMPGMTGAEFSARLKELSPMLPIIMITGFVAQQSAIETIDHSVMKPLSRGELCLAIEKVLSMAKKRADKSSAAAS